MDARLMLVVGLLLIGTSACGHASSHARAEHGVRIEDCNSVAARIQALMAQGRFAEARALIAEASAGGLISREHAARLLNDIAKFNTKLGDLPATLQRAKNFPSQLRDYTLYEIEKMLNGKDFSIATRAQLKMAKKLILQSPRLMGKGGDL